MIAPYQFTILFSLRDGAQTALEIAQGPWIERHWKWDGRDVSRRLLSLTKAGLVVSSKDGSPMLYELTERGYAVLNPPAVSGTPDTKEDEL